MNNIYFNPSTPFLYKHAISLFKDIQLSSTGALVAYSGKYTGRKPDWKKIVNDQNTEDIWWGKINNPISTEDFNDSKKKAIQHIYNNSITYQVDLFINWNPNYQIKVRLLTNNPYHALFLKNMCIQSDNVHDTVDFTIYDSSDITYRNNEGLIGLNLTTNEFIIIRYIKNPLHLYRIIAAQKNAEAVIKI